MFSLDSTSNGEYPTLGFGCPALVCWSWNALNTNLMNNFCCEPRVALRCCDTVLELYSYRYPPAMLAAMASLYNSAAVNWWVCPSRCGLKLKLIGFPAIQIPVYLVITPHLRTVTLAWRNPLSDSPLPQQHVENENQVLKRWGAFSEII